MDENQYIKHVIVECQIKSVLYYTQGNKWRRIHWFLGIANGILAATITVVSFLASSLKWADPTLCSTIGGIVLTVSSSITAPIKAGQNETINEKAGDAYQNFKESLLAEYTKDADVTALKKKAEAKLEKLINKYVDLDPKTVESLRAKTEQQLFSA